MSRIDFETFSMVDLKVHGAEVYARDPSTEVLCMAYDNGDGVRLWWPGEPFPELTPPYHAWNAPFEMAICEHVLPRYGIFMSTEPGDWRCTMASALAKGMPGALDVAAKVLGIPAKRKDGQVVMRRHSKPRKPTKSDPSTRHILTPDDKALLGEYCKHDVIMEGRIGDVVGELSPGHQRRWEATIRMNRRGVRIDTAMCEGAGRIDTVLRAHHEARLAEITGGVVTTGGQLARMIEWAATRGARAHTLTKDVIVGLLERDTLPPDVREMLELRQMLGRSSITKYAAMLAATCDDGRARNLIQYHGAATGRDAGRLFQPQNLPRPGEDMEHYDQPMLAACASLVAAGDVDTIEASIGPADKALPSLLRAALRAEEGHRLIAADLAGIENRVVAMLGGETWQLDQFRDYDANGGRDMYCRAADAIFGYTVTKAQHPAERQVGKILVLSCGFGGWLGAWRKFDTSDKHTDDDVCRYMGAWREKHPGIVALWHNLELAATKTVRTGRPHATNHVVYMMEGDWLVCQLPSGRKLYYRKPRIEIEPHRYKDEMTAVLYAEAYKAGQWTTVSLYGGLLAENVTQAIACDIMMEGAERAEKAGYRLILRVHDELVAEMPRGEGSVDELIGLMVAKSAWLSKLDLPIAAAGWEGERYWK